MIDYESDRKVFAAFLEEVATTCTDERVRLAAVRMLAMMVLEQEHADAE